jgi:hexokinase
MKRVTITLEFGKNDSEYIDKHSGGCDVGPLLRDALGEFEAARQPVAEYVAKRYTDISGTTISRAMINTFNDFRVASKARDVEKRCKMAETLRRADVTILVEDKS